ncbi:MAG: sigma 54-interacting transcriptional regulator, partial [Candidatus Babeliales bacterium]|nr:sigma 54-interacting transcriptional regulator [Candidatus Babeliales bacterium]
MLESVLFFVESFIGSYPFLFASTILALSLRAGLLLLVIARGSIVTTAKRSWIFLLMVLVGSMISDSAWLPLILRKWLLPALGLPILDYSIGIFWSRIAWGFWVIQYQALALFLESLIDQQNRLKIGQKISLLISASFCLFFIGLAFTHINCYHSSDRLALEFRMQCAFALYSQLLMLSVVVSVLLKMRSMQLPRILKKQLKLLIQWLIVPYLVFDFIQYYPFGFSSTYVSSNFAVISLSTLLITFAIFYCSRKVMGLRFLNIQSHVQDPQKFSFIDNFKDVLEQLGYATSLKELGHITQTFFKDGFNIQLRRTALYVRKLDGNQDMGAASEISVIESQAEIILSGHDQEISSFIAQSKILIHDELAFSQFYERDRVTNAVLSFLQDINADIVLPIYEKQRIIAYIIVERDARSEFYSNIDRDEMLVFGSYLGNIIHLLQNRNLEVLIHQEKELKEELYNKHQEINQYKESIRSFLKNNKQKEIGIIFYKNRRFIFGNQTAKELVKININTQEGHPLTQALKQIARQVEEYKSFQTCIAKDSDGNKLVLCGVPNLEQSNVIITIYYPEISDIIAKQLDRLKDPSKWDYLLYLETTQSGQLINQLIPGSGEQLLNFKINLLKTALSRKATLLTMADQDLVPTVELLHHISLRETLHILSLQGPEKNFDTAVKLFGMNPIFGITGQMQQPLFKKLDGTGTLFIQNIQFLAPETQEYLAEFIQYGVYRVFKSDQKISSNVRIICSTNQDLQALMQEGKFSKNLFNELKKTS